MHVARPWAAARSQGRPGRCWRAPALTCTAAAANAAAVAVADAGDVAVHGAAELDQVRVSCFRGEREHRGRGAVDRHAAPDQVREHGERHGERLPPDASQLGQRRRLRSGAERCGRRSELGRRGRGAEGIARVAQIEGQPADRGDDAVSRGPFGRTFEGALHQRLGGERGRACRIDQRRDDRPGDRVEPRQPRIELLRVGCGRHESGRDQAGADPVPPHRHVPPTVTTELGVPNSSSRAAGAAGSASHLTPSTRKA